MLAQAERSEVIRKPDIHVEEYAHSLSTLRSLGALAIEANIDHEFLQLVESLAYDDFATAVTEMLKTDAEFRHDLDINNTNVHKIENGEACASDGRTMVGILENGAASSRRAAKDNPELFGQVERDECDIDIAKRADTLQIGKTLWGISMEPKDELKNYKKTYGNLGYKEGLIYLQTYSKVDENTIISGSFSVDSSNESIWRRILAKRGMVIPENESNNKWLLHAVESDMTSSEAQLLATELRSEFYNEIGVDKSNSSVSEYAELNKTKIKGFFDALYPSLAKATYTGQNNEILQNFAKTLLSKQIVNLKPEIQQKLTDIAKSEKFDDDSAKIMDSIVRYAVVEELRKGIKDFIVRAPESKAISTVSNAPDLQEGYMAQVMNVNTLLANNIRSGVNAGRSYGGCPGNIELTLRQNEANESYDNMSDLQQAYGGNGKEKILKCVTCPLCKKEGIDAHITYNDSKQEKTITCSSCRKSKTYSDG